MAEEVSHRALLLGLVKVTPSLQDLDDQALDRVVGQCHELTTGGKTVASDGLECLDGGMMMVKVVVDGQHLEITSDEVVVSRHSLGEQCTINTVEGTSSHLVFMGHCEMKGLCLAVVLDLMTEHAAQHLKETLSHRTSPLQHPPLQPSTSEKLSNISTHNIPASSTDQHKDEILPHDTPPSSPSRLLPSFGEALTSTSVKSDVNLLHHQQVSPSSSSPVAAAPNEVNKHISSPKDSSISTLSDQKYIKPPVASKPVFAHRPIPIKTVSNNKPFDPLMNLTQKVKEEDTQVTCTQSAPSHTAAKSLTPIVPSAAAASIFYLPTLPTKLQHSSRSITPLAICHSHPAPEPTPETEITKPLVSRSLSTSMISRPVMSIKPVLNENARRSSLESFNTQEVNKIENSKVKLIPGTLKVNEWKHTTPPKQDSKLPQRQTSSHCLDHELLKFMINENEYLHILKTIKHTKCKLNLNLQTLLRGTDTLLNFHEDLCRELYEAFPSYSSFVKVFLSHKEGLEQYKYYLLNAQKIKSCLDQQKDEMNSKYPTLEEDIKTSWKRLNFYCLTFEKLSRMMSTEDQPLVLEVLDFLKEINKKGDSALLIDAITGSPVNLSTLGTLLQHGLFHLSDSANTFTSKTKYYVLLFGETIVIASAKKKGKNEECQYLDHLPVRQLNVLQSKDKESFVLELIKGGEKKNIKYTFRPCQKEAKDEWLSEIARIQMEYLEEVKRHTKLRYSVA